MDELIKTFHIDWKLLIAQAVNFAIVFAILYFFALKPLMKIMKDRTNKISAGLENAKLSEQKLQESEKQMQKLINEGRKEAQTIVNKSQQEAQKIHDTKIAQTKEDVQKVINQAKSEIQEQKNLALKQITSEISELVLLTTQKLTEQTLDAKNHQELIDRAIENVQDEMKKS